LLHEFLFLLRKSIECLVDLLDGCFVGSGNVAIDIHLFLYFGKIMGDITSGLSLLFDGLNLLVFARLALGVFSLLVALLHE
jgi:hypothetical protein